jgi:hypothetical protein
MSKIRGVIVAEKKPGQKNGEFVPGPTLETFRKVEHAEHDLQRIAVLKRTHVQALGIFCDGQLVNKQAQAV